MENRPNASWNIMFPSRRIRYGFSTIPAGLPGTGLYHLVWCVLPFSYLLRKPSTIWRETSRLTSSETGVLGTRKIGTGKYCRVTRVQFWRPLTWLTQFPCKFRWTLASGFHIAFIDTCSSVEALHTTQVTWADIWKQSMTKKWLTASTI